MIAAPAADDVARRLDSLIGIVSGITKILPNLASQPVAVIPQQVAAGGYGVSAGQSIGTLSNVTISNPVITGGSVPSSSIVGTLGNAIDTALGEIDDLTSNTVTATNASTSNLTAADAAIGALSLGTGPGFLAVDSNGNVSATSSVGAGSFVGVLTPLNGGTGLSSAPSYGSLLVGNGTGYSLAATSSLGLPTFSSNNVWNGTNTFSIASTTNLFAQSASFASLSGAAFSSLTSSYLPKWNNGTLSNSLVYDNGTGVGIGTSSPYRFLSVAGSAVLATSQPSFQLQDVGNSNRVVTLSLYDGYNLKLDTGGGSFSIFSGTAPPHLGLGTSTSASVLSVKGQSITTGYEIFTTDNNNNPIFTVQDSGKVGVGSLLTVGSTLFPYYLNAITTTASTTLGSAVITVSNVSGIQVGQNIYGDATTFPQPIWIIGINGASITMSSPAGASNSSISVQFGTNRWDTNSTVLSNLAGIRQGYFGAASEGNSVWTSTSFPNSDYSNSSTILAIAPQGGVGIFGATRTSDSPTGGQASSLVLLGRNDSTSSRTMWNSYIQTEIPATAVPSMTFGSESDVYNQQPGVSVDPFGINVVGATINQRLGCAKSSTGLLGGQDCSAAMDVINNGSSFRTGINFGSSSLSTTVYNNPPAISLPAGVNGYAIDWYTKRNVIGWSLYSNDTSSNLKQIALQNTSITVLNSTFGVGTTSPWGQLSASSTSLNPALTVQQNSSGPVAIFLGGNLGVGTTSPYQSLSIAGNAIFATSKPSLQLQDVGNSNRVANLSFFDGYNLKFDTGGGNLSFYSGSNAANIGIGTSTSLSAFSVKGLSQTTNYEILTTDSANNPVFAVKDNGRVGIGTTTPFSRLEVWGPDTASTTAFSVVNNASTTVFASYDNGNATYSGSLFQSSDQRLKTNVTSLDASSSLSLVDSLHPVSYTRIDQPDQGSTLGFIAQEVQKLFPNLVSTTSPTTLTPGGTLTLNYTGLIAPLVAAVQALQNEIASIQGTIAGFAQSFTTALLHANEADVQKLCVGTTCVTPAQFQAMVAAANAASAGPLPQVKPAEASDASATPPVISINGANPAVISVNAAYSDLGATITGPAADLHLGIATYLNGVLMSPLSVDTSQAATDTIEYAVTDQNGLTSTSTRTVIVQAAQQGIATTSATGTGE